MNLVSLPLQSVSLLPSVLHLSYVLTNHALSYELIS
jgi:hypothetical protein